MKRNTSWLNASSLTAIQCGMAKLGVAAMVALLLMAVSAHAQQAATLVSDKDDYAPGEIAILTGAGFQPFEVVDVSLSIDDTEAGLHIGDYDWTIEQADADGGFETWFEVPYEAAGMTLTATAMGYSSALVATVMFTDNVITLHSATLTLGTGNDLCLSAVITTVGGSISSVIANIGGTHCALTSTDGNNWSGCCSGECGTTYKLNNIAVQTTGGSSPRNKTFAGNDPVISAVEKVTTAACCTATNSPPTLSASNVNLGTVCTADGSYTMTLTPGSFDPQTTDPEGLLVTVTFGDGTDSKQVTLTGNASETLTLQATDTVPSNACQGVTAQSVTTDVTVSATILTQPTNTAPTLSASDKSFGDIIPVVAPGTVMVTVVPSDFLPATHDDDGDTVAVTFGDGSASKEITFSEAHQSESVTLMATDNGSARSQEGCTTLSDLSTTTEVSVSASVHNCPSNTAPMVSASEYAVGPFNVTAGCSVTVSIAPDDFNPGYSDSDGDPQSGGFSLSANSVTLNAANEWTATVTLSATDDPSARNDVLCYPLNPMTGSTTVTVRGTANILTNAAPEITASDYLAGHFCVEGTDSVTIQITPSSFDATATDPDGDDVGALTLSSDSVELTLPSELSDGVVEAQVTVSATDDPSERNATLDSACTALPAMTASMTVKVKATLHRNNAPTIGASDLDLGRIVGCLVGGSFQTTVSFDVEDFSPVTGDSDGDPVSVTADISSATLVGPGMAEADVVLTAVDDPSGRASCLTPKSSSTTVKVKVQIVYGGCPADSPLTFQTPFPPANKSLIVKRGSGFPIKFRLYDCSGTEISAPDLVSATISVRYVSGSVPIGDPTVTDSGAANDNGINFRYSGTPGTCTAPGTGNWIYNLKTNSTYAVGASYAVTATLNDGTSISGPISIK